MRSARSRANVRPAASSRSGCRRDAAAARPRHATRCRPRRRTRHLLDAGVERACVERLDLKRPDAAGPTCTEASLTATPIRRSPTSKPTMRPTPYNSRTLGASPDVTGGLLARLGRCGPDTARPGRHGDSDHCGTPVPRRRCRAAQAPRQDAQARRVGDRMQALQREAEQLAAQSRTLLGDLRQLEIERDLRTEEAQTGGSSGDRRTAVARSPPRPA